MNLVENLRTRLTRKIAMAVELAQSSMLEKIGHLLPEEQRAFIQLTPHNIPLEISYILDCSNLFCDFKEDIDFNLCTRGST